MPMVPSLFSEISMPGNLASDPSIYGPQTNTHILEAGEIIDLEIINTLVHLLVFPPCSIDIDVFLTPFGMIVMEMLTLVRHN
jgi:hypothetical protein